MPKNGRKTAKKTADDDSIELITKIDRASNKLQISFIQFNTLFITTYSK